MLIHLVGPEDGLLELCQEVLSKMPEAGRDTVLEAVDADEGWCDADVHIWNFRPGLSVPDAANWTPLRHLFLADRSDIGLLQQRTGALDGNLMLKPVSPGTLTVYLGAAVLSRAAKSLRGDRDEMLQCLIETNLKLQEYDQQRNAFLRRAIHDLGGPLTALRGYCDLLFSEPMGPLTESQMEVLRRMQDSARRLARTSSAMAELSAGRNGEGCADLQPGDIRECVQQILAEIAPFADEKELSITADLEPCDSLYFEAGRMEQALAQLLDNACRFTTRAGAIEIRGYPYFWERRNGEGQRVFGRERRGKTIRTANSYRIDIGGSSSPIPEEHLGSIFEEHNDCAAASDRSGGGLGLAICKRIMSQHRGRVWAENRDGGPVFSIVLPTYSTDPRFPAESERRGEMTGVRSPRYAD